jgi:membrane protein DedA with SNARE-associated domain
MSRPLLRLLILVVVVLLLPIVPFVLWGDQLEPWFEGKIQQEAPLSTIAAVGIGALVADILLPVPSSVVGTVIGIKAPWIIAVAIIWIGQTLGAIVGYFLARVLGRPLLNRFCSADDLSRLEWLAAHHGSKTLLLTRALPVLAEASILLFGMLRYPLRRFLIVVGFANLLLAVVYATLGHFGQKNHAQLFAIIASIVIPLIATGIARWLIPSRKVEGPKSKPVT